MKISGSAARCATGVLVCLGLLAGCHPSVTITSTGAGIGSSSIPSLGGASGVSLIIPLSESGALTQTGRTVLERESAVYSQMAVGTGAESTSGALRNATSVPIFMYHFIEVVQDKKDTLREAMAVTPTQFEEQLKFLSENDIHTYFVRDVPRFLDGTLSDPKRVMLTFDDGYEDFYTDAFPLLMKYGAKATLYVINDRIGTKDYLTQAQLTEIAQSGIVEIGAHTIDHPDLRTLSAEKQRHQIADSKHGLEEMLGVTVDSFAYPYGYYTDETVKLVREAGFVTAVTTKPGKLQSPSMLLTLRRLRPGPVTSAKGLHWLLGE